MLRRALVKAAAAAMRYNLDVTAGMKAFDGPPLGPRDVRELLLRNFRIKLSVPEATALVGHFTKVIVDEVQGRQCVGLPCDIRLTCRATLVLAVVSCG